MKMPNKEGVKSDIPLDVIIKVIAQISGADLVNRSCQSNYGMRLSLSTQWELEDLI